MFVTFFTKATFESLKLKHPLKIMSLLVFVYSIISSPFLVVTFVVKLSILPERSCLGILGAEKYVKNERLQ